MKIKSKSILSIVLALNLMLPIGYINNTNSYATAIDENEIIDKWDTTKTPMPTMRSRFTSEVVNDKIYCIGGFDGSNYLNTVEVYDPETDRWETKAPMPTSRGYLASEVIDGKIYCIGGANTSPLNIIEVYDPETDNWDAYKTHMPTMRYGLATEIIDGKIYCIGGYNSTNGYLNIIEVYDPESNSWETKAPMSTSRAYLASEVVNGKIYCIGGYYNTTKLNTVEVYDSETDSWETKTPMPTMRGGLTSVVINGKIYCIGGYNSTSRYLNIIEVYDTETDNWDTSKTPMPTARENASSVFVNGKIYCIGGRNAYVLDVVEVYILNINTPEYRAEQKVIKAEQTNELNDIESARYLVNNLPESSVKTELQDRLNAIIPNINLTSNSATANIDIYIKLQNSLHITLSTNSVSFDDYSGVDEIEKPNALSISINSSLSYQLNAYLLDEIYNNDKTKKIDIDRLQIKDNEDTTYKEFTAINDKLVLKDNCNSGNDKTHNIDLKLKGGNAYESDIYKTVIKFETEQK